jgi:serine protease Do
MKTLIAIILGLVACFVVAILAVQADRQWFRRDGTFSFFAEQNHQVIPARLEPTPGSLAVPFDFREPAARLMPSVVSVDRMTPVRPGMEEDLVARGTGSGVILNSEGHILTNAHVVDGAASVQVRLADRRSFEAKVIGSDRRSDLAVLKIEAPNLVPAELGDSAKVQVGEWVMAVGNPLGYDNTVSVGVVSSLDRVVSAGIAPMLVGGIQTDAAINQGNSGGALANAAGQVIGINSMIASTTGGSIGIGFAIPINRAREVVDQIIRTGRVTYAGLGISPHPGTQLLALPSARRQMAREYGAEPPSTGVLVGQMDPQGAAAQAGIRPLDIILEIDGKALERPEALYMAFLTNRPGDRLQVRYWSRGQTRTVNVVLQELVDR